MRSRLDCADLGEVPPFEIVSVAEVKEQRADWVLALEDSKTVAMGESRDWNPLPTSTH